MLYEWVSNLTTRMAMAGKAGIAEATNVSSDTLNRTKYDRWSVVVILTDLMIATL